MRGPARIKMQHQQESGNQENFIILSSRRRLVILKGESFQTKWLQDNSLDGGLVELFQVLWKENTESEWFYVQIWTWMDCQNKDYTVTSGEIGTSTGGRRRYRSLVVSSQLHILPCDVLLRMVKNKGNKARSSCCVKGISWWFKFKVLSYEKRCDISIVMRWIWNQGV